MSIRLMSMVFEAQSLTGTQKLVLLSLADHANDDGLSIYPSQATTARRTSLSEREVRRVLLELEDLTIIHKVKGARQHRSAEYTLDVAVLASLTPRADSESGLARPDSGSARPDSGSRESSLTIKEPSEEPSEGAEKAPRPRDPLWDALVEVTGASTKRMTASVGKVKKALLEESPPYSPEEVRAFGRWYAEHHPVNRVPSLWKLLSEIGIIRSPNGKLPAQSRSEPISEARRRGEAIRRTLTHVDVSGFRTAPTAGELGLVPGVPGTKVASPGSPDKPS